ncbi:MAG: metallophosphoesterase family protein [Planctomycetota bacterium]
MPANWSASAACLLALISPSGVLQARNKTDQESAGAGRGPASFVVFGDTQQMPLFEWAVRGGPKERAQVREKIKELNPDFILFAGDAVGEGFLKPFWNSFHKHYRDLPIWPVLGNHDLHGPRRLGLRYYFQTFPKVEKRRWYPLRRPPVLVLMLDSNFKKMSRKESERQMSWLAESLTAAERDPEIRAVLIVAHHPPYSVHMGGGEPRVRKAFWDSAAKHAKFVAFFSGHHHAYQHIAVGRRHAFVCGGGGAPLSLFRTAKLPPGASLVRARMAHHLLHARIEKDGIRLRMLQLRKNGSWREEDTLFLPWPELRPLRSREKQAAPGAHRGDGR